MKRKSLFMENTEVPAERTAQEIQQLLAESGATGGMMRPSGDYCNLCQHGYCIGARADKGGWTWTTVIELPDRRRTKLHLCYCAFHYGHFYASGNLKSVAVEIEKLSGYRLTGGNFSHREYIGNFARLHQWRFGPGVDGTTQLMELAEPVLESGPSSYRFKRVLLKAIRPLLNRDVQKRNCSWCKKRFSLYDPQHHACEYALFWVRRFGELPDETKELVDEGVRILQRGYSENTSISTLHAQIKIAEARVNKAKTNSEWREQLVQLRILYGRAKRFEDIENKLFSILERYEQASKLEQRRWRANRRVFKAVRNAVRENDISKMETILQQIRPGQTEA
jgi:hypothetical protein